jgi:ankyrin repeat protein
MEGLKNKTRSVFFRKLCFLLIACNAGHYEIVELLLKYNANVNIQSTSGNTALHYSAGGVKKKKNYFESLININFI